MRSCALITLDSLGQMYVVIWHNLRDVIAYLCRHAHLSVGVEKGHGLTRDHSHTRPVDILIAGWDRGKPAALDITVHHPSPLPSWENQTKWQEAGKQLSNGPQYMA